MGERPAAVVRRTHGEDPSGRPPRSTTLTPPSGGLMMCGKTRATRLSTDVCDHIMSTQQGFRSLLLAALTLSPVLLCSCQAGAVPVGPPPPPPVPVRPFRVAAFSLGGDTELVEIRADSVREGLKLFQFTEG